MCMLYMILSTNIIYSQNLIILSSFSISIEYSCCSDLIWRQCWQSPAHYHVHTCQWGTFSNKKYLDAYFKLERPLAVTRKPKGSEWLIETCISIFKIDIYIPVLQRSDRTGNPQEGYVLHLYSDSVAFLFSHNAYIRYPSNWIEEALH